LQFYFLNPSPFSYFVEKKLPFLSLS